ncbi:hypothetical protein TKK_0010679 [Trichogramma kaykai]
MLEKSLLSSFLGMFIIITASNAKNLQPLEPVLEGGHIARPDKFKPHVSIQVLGPYGCTYHLCEGAILDERHIITTAFCAIAHKDKNLVVVAGVSDLRDKEAGLYHEVQHIYTPKTYRLRLESHDNIAILKLKKPLPLGTDSRIQAVKLPTAHHSVEKDFALLMTGYGFYEQHPNGTVKLATRGSPVLRWDIQTNPFNDEKCDADDKEFCTVVRVFELKSTTCNRHSGAPLVEVKLLAHEQIEFTLIGVSKIVNPHWCGSYAKYTKVSAYLDFISNVRNQVLNDVQSETITTDDNANKLREYPDCHALE